MKLADASSGAQHAADPEPLPPLAPPLMPNQPKLGAGVLQTPPKLGWENSDTGLLGASYMPKNVIVQDTETRESGPDFTQGYGEDVSVPREPQSSDQVFHTDQASTESTPFLRQLMPSQQTPLEPDVNIDQINKSAMLVKTAYRAGVQHARSAYGV